MNQSKLEPIVILLFVGILVFAGLIFVSEKYYPMDGQIFQVMAGLLSGFSASFFTRIKSKTEGPTIPEGGSGTQTTVVKVPGDESKDTK